MFPSYIGFFYCLTQKVDYILAKHNALTLTKLAQKQGRKNKQRGRVIFL